MTTPPKPTRWWGFWCLCASSAWSGWLGCPGSSASSTKWKKWVQSPADLKAVGPPWSLPIAQIRCEGSHFTHRTRPREQSWLGTVGTTVLSDLLQVRYEVSISNFTQLYEVILFIPYGTRSCGICLVQVYLGEHHSYYLSYRASLVSRSGSLSNFSHVFSDEIKSTFMK